jgi:hypothetical protein
MQHSCSHYNANWNCTWSGAWVTTSLSHPFPAMVIDWSRFAQVP